MTRRIIFTGVFLIAASRKMQLNRDLVTLIIWQNTTFGLLFAVYGWIRLGNPFILIQWTLFLPLALLLWFGLLRDASARRH